jgi:hypothetical protein
VKKYLFSNDFFTFKLFYISTLFGFFEPQLKGSLEEFTGCAAERDSDYGRR